MELRNLRPVGVDIYSLDSCVGRTPVAFSTVEQIKQAFEISCDDPEEIRRALRRKLKAVHPDAIGEGRQDSPASREAVIRITEAMDFLDGAKRGTAMVPVDEVVSLVKAIRDLVPAGSREKELQERLFKQVDGKVREAKTAGRTPRIVLTAGAMLLTLVWLFPALTGGNPVLSKVVDVRNPVFNVVWLSVLLYTGAMWLVFKLWSEREAGFRKGLKLEAVQNRLFESFAAMQAGYVCKGRPIVFSKDQLVSHIRGTYNRGSGLASLLKGRPMAIDSELAQTLAEILLLKAESRGVVRKVEKQSLEETYELAVPVGEF